jgi:hypothetical protein
VDDEKWSRGWKLITHGLVVLKNYPSFILPILIAWLVYAPGVLFLKYFFHWGRHTTAESLIIIYFFIVAFSFCILVACDVLLELIQQTERGDPSLTNAIAATLRKDLANLLPLAFAWATIWFVLSLLEVLVSRRREDDSGDLELTVQGAAEVLTDFGNFSLNRALFDALRKGIRMLAFLILPAIAWENMDFVNATCKGMAVLRARIGDFARGYALTYAAAAVAFLPPSILLLLGTGRRGQPPLFHFPEAVWVVTIIYVGLAWSFSIYLEQMFCAQLYLWHTNWERKFEVARLTHRPLPAFKDVELPTLLAKVPNLFGEGLDVDTHRARAAS